MRYARQQKKSLLKGLNSHFLSSSKQFLFFPGYLFIAVIAIGFTGMKADWGATAFAAMEMSYVFMYAFSQQHLPVN